jgi:subtilase family serine protease
MGTTELAFYNSLWQQAASEGISAFVSSGDSGAAGCNGGSSSSASVAGVNGLCSSPYSTCVGGTEFNEGSNPGQYWSASNGAGGGSALSYIPEKVWNESASDGGSGLWSSGGGVSEVYTQPTWQKGVSGANSNGMRAVPDVALSAAGHDGYLICEFGNWYVIAGTSAASPSFSGIMALAVQKAGTASVSEIGQGNANPTLYGLLTASANPFHATPSGNNSVPGVNGFTASGAAYNLATGLGSVDANLLVNQWPVSKSGVQQGFTLKASVGSESLVAGKSATFTLSVAGTGGFTGAVNLSAAAPAGVTVTFNPASVKAGATSTVTVAVAGSAAAGTSSITLTGSSGSLSSTAKVTLAVTAAPTITVSTAATTLSLTQGKSATMSVTVTTGGSFSGTVALTAANVPNGVTATWSPSSFASTGSKSTTATLTLKAAATTELENNTIKLFATGDGLQSLTEVTLEVTAAAAAVAK